MLHRAAAAVLHGILPILVLRGSARKHFYEKDLIG
jgi:hypothetical protein